jgi:hypothetical protein
MRIRPALDRAQSCYVTQLSVCILGWNTDGPSEVRARVENA